jgi:hypothetical protein
VASLIEQAAERLEQLRRAGAMMPEEDAPVPAAASPTSSSAAGPQATQAPAARVQPVVTAKRV